MQVIQNRALCACLLFGAAMAAMGCSREEDLHKCQSVDPDTKIAGCTALIQAAQDTRENLSLIYNSRGNAYDSRGLAYDNKDDHRRAFQDYNEAIHDYTEAIRLNPNDAAAYYGRGLVYDRRGIEHDDRDDYDRSIQDYNEAIRLSPKDAGN
jgi:tetratricopeptide (TPR) repeat protein